MHLDPLGDGPKPSRPGRVEGSQSGGQLEGAAIGLSRSRIRRRRARRGTAPGPSAPRGRGAGPAGVGRTGRPGHGALVRRRRARRQASNGEGARPGSIARQTCSISRFRRAARGAGGHRPRSAVSARLLDEDRVPWDAGCAPAACRSRRPKPSIVARCLAEPPGCDGCVPRSPMTTSPHRSPSAQIWAEGRAGADDGAATWRRWGDCGREALIVPVPLHRWRLWRRGLTSRP